MKEIIYLDTSFLHSYMAQHNKGLPMSHVIESLEQDTSTTIDRTQKSGTNELMGKIGTGSVQIPMVFSSPSGEASYKYKIQNTTDTSYQLSQLDAGKEIISKHLHDNALTDFESYMTENGQLIFIDDAQAAQPGMYIKFTSKFELIDLASIENIFSKELLLRILEIMAKNNLSEKLSAINSNQEMNNSQKQAVKKQISETSKKGLEDIASTFELLELSLKYLNTILPTPTILRTNRLISLLKPDFLRETSKGLSFKYGRSNSLQITLIGKVTRILDEFMITDAITGDFFNMIGSITEFYDTMLEQINIIKKGDVIISPVAIYFE